jgi:capsular exopolysaccharide synthesis family protein
MKKANTTEIIDIKSPMSEAYKTLRSNIQFSSLDIKIKTIVVTSSLPGEGRTTTASNLAIAMAQAGSKTILLDCDLRTPFIHKALNLSNKLGLSNYLIGEVKLTDVIQKTEEENLSVITMGAKPLNPSELLSSLKMKEFIISLKEKHGYEYIIIDTPPVILVTDALILAQYADGCILVVAASETKREAVAKAKSLLTKVNVYILGVVLNKLDISKRKYFGYDSDYYYLNDENQKEKSKKIRGIPLSK